MVKKLFLFLVFVSLGHYIIAQDITSTVFVQVNHVNNKPVMEDLSCWLTDNETGQKNRSNKATKWILQI